MRRYSHRAAMKRDSARWPSLLASAAILAMVAGLAVWMLAPSPRPEGIQTAHPAPPNVPIALLDKPRPLPEFQFTDAAGRPLTLKDFRGRVVLLNLWATWCVPCRAEMPTLDRLQARLGGPRFEVVALSIDRQGLNAVKPVYDELGLTSLQVYLDPTGRATVTLGAAGIPTTRLIDRHGREIGRLSGTAEWDTAEMEDFIKGYLPPTPASHS